MIVNMEVNGRAYYMKSNGSVPYLYDIDTHDAVGYWSSKKGQYVMFSLYNKLISNLKEKKQYTQSNECDNDDGDDGDDGDDDVDETDSSKSQQDDDELEFETDSDSESEATTDVTSESQTSRMNTYLSIFIFLILFVYLTLQKEFQSIYFDIVFLVLINLLNTLKVFEFMNDD
jgi:hypothetical protein